MAKWTHFTEQSYSTETAVSCFALKYWFGALHLKTEGEEDNEHKKG